MNISLTKTELAELAGYTYKQLHDIDQKLPKEEKLFASGEDGKFDLAIFVRRLVAYHAKATCADKEISKKDLADLAGYSYRRLYDIDQKLSKEEKLFVAGEDGKYDLALFIQRWVAYRLAAERGDEDTLEDVKAVHERVKTQKTELEVARMRGELVAVQDIRRLWGDVANTVTQAMTALPSRIAPQILMMNSVEAIAAVVDAEVRAVLQQISETPVPDYATQETDEPDEASE